MYIKQWYQEKWYYPQSRICEEIVEILKQKKSKFIENLLKTDSGVNS